MDFFIVSCFFCCDVEIATLASGNFQDFPRSDYHRMCDIGVKQEKKRGRKVSLASRDE